MMTLTEEKRVTKYWDAFYLDAKKGPLSVFYVFVSDMVEELECFQPVPVHMVVRVNAAIDELDGALPDHERGCELIYDLRRRVKWVDVYDKFWQKAE